MAESSGMQRYFGGQVLKWEKEHLRHMEQQVTLVFEIYYMENCNTINLAIKLQKNI